MNSIRPLLLRKRAAVMAVINITPDSFSDGALFLDPNMALSHSIKMIQNGADILDIGAESTRPGAEAVSLQEELDRAIPVIECLSAETDVPISIDTYKPEVMEAAINAGAQMINDVNALQSDGAIDIVAKYQVPVCLMHMHGQPKTMQEKPVYKEVVNDVLTFLQQRIEFCVKHKIARSDIVIDPGIGFGKTLEHNLSLLKQVSRLKSESGCNVMIGVSRKSLIDKLLGRAVDKRLPASIGLAVQAVLNGAKIVRVHDVSATRDAIRSVEAVQRAAV